MFAGKARERTSRASEDTSLRGSDKTALLVLASGLAAAAAIFAVAPAFAAGKSASGPRQLTVFAVATQEEFLNHSDDRVRGDANNPLQNFSLYRSTTKQVGKGPFAGDRAVFLFKLFSDAALSNVIGSATYSCQYAFFKHGICQAEYLVNGGSLLGIGYLDFNAHSFVFAVSGGTGTYSDARGDVAATPDGTKRANRLFFTLL